MNDSLLPEGLRDELPPTALKEHHLVLVLEKCFEKYGYKRVKPPLAEFEATLHQGNQPSAKKFLAMDPITQRTMAIRSDITPQVARIARTRLVNEPRPLRLSYTGQVLRVKGDSLRPERQFTQAGFELIGSEAIIADLEVLSIAIYTLKSIGISQLSVDLTSPILVPTICASYNLGEEDVAIARRVMDRKDLSQLPESWPQDLVTMLAELIACTGPFEVAMKRFESLVLPEKGLKIRESLKSLATLFSKSNPDVDLTIDLGEYHGFEYQTGLGFTLFSRGVNSELGRGGRYCIDSIETAVGASIYLDTILKVIPDPKRSLSILVPHSLKLEQYEQLHEKGYATVWCHTEGVDVEVARSQKCDFIWNNGHIEPVMQGVDV